MRNGTRLPSLTSVFVTMVCLVFCAAARAEEPSSAQDALHSETGVASFYAKRFDGRRTASGEVFRNSALMAAHHSFPFGTLVRVTNLDRGTSVDVRIADRGAFKRAHSIVIDLSQAAAERLRMLAHGRARVLLEVLEWGGRGRAPKAFAPAAESAE
jgi:rare lipoprotein A